MSRSGIKCLGNIIRLNARGANQVRPGVCRAMANDVSKRKLYSLAGINWNVDGLSTKLTKNSITKFSYSSSSVIGSMSTVKPLLIETIDSSSGDMLECLGGDDDSDTWSYI